ncbi:MAG: hypothetical protein NT001_04490 [Candidatus Woesearchaeota archaeon]|nr:hypothetical protein [Candidatus Woesearchaeota archaeon]
MNKQELSDLTQMVRDGTWQQEGALKDYDHRGMTVPVKLSF